MDIISPDEEWSTGGFFGETIEFKFVPTAPDGSDDAGTVEGYAATFAGLDRHNDTIDPGAFVESLAQHKAHGSAPGFLWNHKQADPIGKLTGLGEDARGLRFRARLNLATDSGARAYQHVKAGDITGASIGYAVKRGGADFKHGRRHLKSLDLHEVSLVSSPADMRAQITSVKSFGGPVQLETKGALEALLCDAGLSRGAARKVVAGGWAALAGPEAEPPPFDDIARALRAGSVALQSLRKA